MLIAIIAQRRTQASGRAHSLNRQSKHQRQGLVHLKYEIGGSLARRQPRQLGRDGEQEK